MKIIILSGGIKGKHSEISAKNTLDDLSDILNINNKSIYVKHIQLENNIISEESENKNEQYTEGVNVKKEKYTHFGLPTNKEKVLPKADILIDWTHHAHGEFSLYNLRLGGKNLFLKNMNRLHLKSYLEQIGIRVNDHIVLQKDFNSHDLCRIISLPIVIKSHNNILPTFIADNHKEMLEYIYDNFDKDGLYLEHYFRDKVYNIVFIKNFRGQKVYSTFIYEKFFLGYKKGENESVRMASYLDDDTKDQIRKIGEKILNVSGANICEIEFMVKIKNINNIKTSDKSEGVLNKTVNSPKSISNIKHINKVIKVNNCYFTPKYIEGKSFYEILKAQGITMFEIVRSIL